MNLICIESAQWLRRYGVGKFQGALITPMGTPIMAPWANDHDVAHLQANTVPKNLIWSASAQCLPSSVVRKIPWALITDSMSPYCKFQEPLLQIPGALITDPRGRYYVHGHVHVAPLGKWPWRCISRGWDSSNELDLEWIGLVVAELRAGRTERQTDGRMETIP